MNLPQVQDLSNLASLAACPAFLLASNIETCAMDIFSSLDVRSGFWSDFATTCDELMSAGVHIDFIVELTKQMERLYSSGLVTHFTERFLHRDDCYFYAVLKNDGKVNYYKAAQSVTRKLIETHLLGDVTLSLPACTKDGFSRWCCFDFDCEDEFLVEELIDILRQMNLKPIREAVRPGRSGHVWLFFDDFIDTEDLILFGKNMLSVIYKEYKNIEFFPATSTGHSQMRLPLGVHLKPDANGQRGWFEGPEKNIRAQLIWLTQQPLNSIQPIQNIAGILRARAVSKVQYLQPSFKRSFEPINWFDAGIEWHLRNGEYQARCPLCADESRDNSCDNLRLSLDGTKINCVLFGPNSTHKTRDIYKRFGSEKCS